MYQNAIPLMPNNFGYGGAMVSYNIFDFGKRERAVKEASAQLGMAEIALQLTKAKVAANLKTAYFELERARQVSQLAQQMGSSMTRLIDVSITPEIESSCGMTVRRSASATLSSESAARN